MKSNFKINEKFQNIVKMLVFSNCFYQYYISLLILLIIEKINFISKNVYDDYNSYFPAYQHKSNQSNHQNL